MKKSIQIPFMGFYNSLLDSEIDNCISQDSEWQEKNPENDRQIPAAEYSELLYQFADFGAMRRQISKDYVDVFNSFVNEEFGVDLCLEFRELVSPREYNFTTDRIFADFPAAKVNELYTKVDRAILEKVINDNLKSRDGFISYYSDFVRNWKNKPVDTWDEIELSMLLYALIGGVDDFDLTMYCKIDDKVDNAFSNNVCWEKVESAVDDYLEENEENEEKDDVDGRVFPPGNLSAADYVAQYCALNNLKNEVNK